MNTISIIQNCVKPIITKKGEIFPCGQCPLCRRKKMLEWVLRGTHELQTNKGDAIFLTLSYKPKYLPREGEKGLKIIKRCQGDAGGNLNPRDMTLFFKRFRKAITKKFGDRPIKYIYCGEYGEIRWRPHYHAIIYGIKPTDFTEQEIKKIWGKGIVKLDQGQITDRAIQYTVGYISKKIINRNTKNTEYIEKGRKPPFLRVSQGIGLDWCNNHIEQITKNGYITTKNGQTSVPRYYIKKIKQSEARKIIFDQTITDKDTNEVIETRRVYKYIENPEAKYTNRLYNLELERSYVEYLNALENTKNEYYFEEVSQYYDDFCKTKARLEKKVSEWFYSKTKSDKYLINWYRNNTTRQEYIKKCNYNANNKKEYKLETKLSKERVENLQKTAQLKVLTLMNGAFGKRQAFEIGLEMQKVT